MEPVLELEAEMENNLKREFNEAIFAGEDALRSLGEARDYLKNAERWGYIDIFGGGAISGLVKHSKIDKASRCISEAKIKLRTFQKELTDIDFYIPEVNVGGFLSFADFFLDGFAADFLVQSKINDAKRQVEDAIFRVENILNALRTRI